MPERSNAHMIVHGVDFAKGYYLEKKGFGTLNKGYYLGFTLLRIVTWLRMLLAGTTE